MCHYFIPVQSSGNKMTSLSEIKVKPQIVRKPKKQTNKQKNPKNLHSSQGHQMAIAVVANRLLVLYTSVGKQRYDLASVNTFLKSL